MLRTPLLLALALVPAAAFAAPTKSKKSGSSSSPVKTSIFSAQLLSVETIRDGRIDAVYARVGNGTPKKFLGCGMRLADHPHLLLAFQSGFVVSIKAENHCIQQIYVKRE